MFTKKTTSESMIKNVDGYITVYLSMILAIILSLCLTLIEGARSNATYLEAQIISDVAMNSIFAEYNRELFLQYNLLAIEDSYGDEKASLENTKNHLRFYLERNMEKDDLFLSSFLYRDFIGLNVDSVDIEGAMYLSDGNGAVFRRRAYEAIKDDVGLTLVSEIINCASLLRDKGLDVIDFKEKLSEVDDSVKESLCETDADETEEKTEVLEIEDSSGGVMSWTFVNPLKYVTLALEAGLSKIMLHKDYDVSKKNVDKSKLISSRMDGFKCNIGNISLEKDACPEIIEQMMFQEYLLRYFGRYHDEKDDGALNYQIEYVISGFENDKDNLDSIIGRIFAIRFAASYLYIIGDEEKCSMADKLGLLISVFTYTEEYREQYKDLILLVWSFGEAAYDTKCILADKKVPLLKNEANWKTPMLNALNGKVLVEDVESDSSEYSSMDDSIKDDEGFSLGYKDYLRLFMYMTNQNIVIKRAMDIVEADIRCTSGNDYFRMDACVDTLDVKIKTGSTFGYHYEFNIRRKYE